MIKGPKFTTSQWKLLASALSNISQGIILFSLAAVFIPEGVGLPKDFPKVNAFGFLVGGLIILNAAVMIVRKGK